MRLGEASAMAGQSGLPARLSAQEPAEPAPSTAATVEPFDPSPLFSGPSEFLWSGFGVVAVIFLVVFVVLLRKVAGSAPAPGGRPTKVAAGRKSKTKKQIPDFFEPAGDDAEITFDDEPVISRRVAAGQAAAHWTDPQEADVVIERPPERRAEAPPDGARPPAFAGIFARKHADDPLTEQRPEPRDHDLVESLEDERGSVIAEAEEARALSIRLAERARAEAEEDERRRLLEEGRLAAERAAVEEARRREAEILRREEEARAAEERAADQERRRQAALLEQREREMARRAEAAALESGALRDLAGEFDRRFAALEQRLEERARPAPPATESNLAEAIASLSDMTVRRLSEHRQGIDAAIEALSRRLDGLSLAAGDLAALRDDMSAIKRAMGGRAAAASFPQVQLADLLGDALPRDGFELRARLATGRTADALIRLPSPPGPIAVDGRFPVEAFQPLLAEGEDGRERADNEFRRAALRHIVDVAEGLISPGETAESAFMFLPSEMMFATLLERFPDVSQDARRAGVWIVSPTTLLATLNAMRGAAQAMRARSGKTEEAPPARLRSKTLGDLFGDDPGDATSGVGVSPEKEVGVEGGALPARQPFPFR